jgi:magnesium chelatase subunit D
MIDSSGEKKPSAVPFPAIVGQNELKRALLACAANPALGGLLVRGEKGTAKSTAVRALVDLLPDQRVVVDCPYGCSPDDPVTQCDDCHKRDNSTVERRPVPLVTVPLGATRERVVGTLSVADALDGEVAFDPGLLARANRGFLYVDEVNLLDDHLVDVLLDAAASGVNRVERDGVSVTHPADFTLIGTMNPEEGDLRPQLRDRFALQATVVGCEDLVDRVEIIDRTLDSARDPEEFAEQYDETVTERTEQLVTARQRLDQDQIDLPVEFKSEIAELCRDAGVDGHRADIAIARTAMTFAALDDRPKVLQTDVRDAAELALPHRLQSRPFEDPPDVRDVIDNHFDNEEERENGRDEEIGEEKRDENVRDQNKAGEEETDRSEPSRDGDENRNSNEHSSDEQHPDSRRCSNKNDGTQADSDADETERGDDGGREENGRKENEQLEGTPLIPGQTRAEIGTTETPAIDPSPVPELSEEGDGSRIVTEPSAGNRGAQVRTERARSGTDIDAATSIRAAAKRGSDRVTSRDLRRSVRSGRASALVVFAVDASASMRHAMRTAKGVVIELLKNAYEQRDSVAFVAFADEDAEVLLPPTNSVTLAARHLKELPTGDRTPLPAGLRTTGEVIARADPETSIVILITDGRANVASESPTEETRNAARTLGEHAHVVVVDTNEHEHENRAGLCRLVSEETKGEHVPLSALSADRINTTISRERKR